MSSRKTATANCPDELPNETTKKGLSKVPDLSESPAEPSESTNAVVKPDPPPEGPPNT